MSRDPNNTSWSKSTDTYGHKILTAQGWKPGDYLGADNASHSDHYTAASASHIRTLLREENLGLGAQIGRGNAETFGLSLFSGVLGRLNGKSNAEVQKQQSALRDAELRTYQAQKYGLMSFMSGGFLVGDRVQSAVETGVVEGQKRANEFILDEEEHSVKKRRRTEDRAAATEQRRKSSMGKTESKMRYDESSTSEDETKPAKPRKSKKSKRERKAQLETSEDHLAPTTRHNYNVPQPTEAETASTKAHSLDEIKRAHKSTKRKDRDELCERTEETRTTTDLSTDNELLRVKQEKRVRKEHRRKRKEEKKASKPKTHTAENESTQEDQNDISTLPEKPEQKAVIANGSRHAIRQRYIQQKRMASIDPRAMKEIFMLKATA